MSLGVCLKPRRSSTPEQFTADAACPSATNVMSRKDIMTMSCAADAPKIASSKNRSRNQLTPNWLRRISALLMNTTRMKSRAPCKSKGEWATNRLPTRFAAKTTDSKVATPVRRLRSRTAFCANKPFTLSAWILPPGFLERIPLDGRVLLPVNPFN